MEDRDDWDLRADVAKLARLFTNALMWGSAFMTVSVAVKFSMVRTGHVAGEPLSSALFWLLFSQFVGLLLLLVVAQLTSGVIRDRCHVAGLVFMVLGVAIGIRYLVFGA